MKTTKIINLGLITIAISFISFVIYNLYYCPVEGIEEKAIWLLNKYGYIILFAWSILEGELGLIMAGLMVKVGTMDYWTAIAIAGLGGFAGDQLYFYIGRNNKEYVREKFGKHNEKLDKAHKLLEKYGWPVIFFQRYLYGLRTVIPISIGLTHYSAKKYFLINLLSGQVWAFITITLAYTFGDEIFKTIEILKNNMKIIIPIIVLLIISIFIIKRIKRNNEDKV